MDYVPAKTIITRTKDSKWFGHDYNMNLYRGCCHGCIYCDSRSDCYRVGDFDRVRAKENALTIIRDELRRKVKTGVVGSGAMSDPYNPFEKELELSRHALELMDAFGFGSSTATKSDLIVRDIDVLSSIREHSPVLCKLTITAIEDEMSRKVEPGAPVSSRRFAALEALSSAGIFAGILLMPVLPFLEDTEANVLGIVRRAKDCGARFIYPAFGMTMRNGQREHYLEQLERIFPGEGLREQYRKKYGSCYQCTSPRARALWDKFSRECGQLGILYRMDDIIHAYKRGYEYTQLRLF